MHGQRHGSKHEHNGAPRRRLGKKRRRSARAERRLAARAAEGARQVGRLAALQHDHDNQKCADDDVQCDQHEIHFPAEGQQAQSHRQRNCPFHFSWHFFSLISEIHDGGKGLRI